MKLTTRVFGEVEVDDNKIIDFPNGIIGFPDLKRFTLMHDEDEDASTIMWLQSIDEPEFALPVMNPLIVCPDYKPMIDKNGVAELGELDDQEILVLVTVTVPHDLTKMTVNLMGPIIINTKNMKASQNIVDNDEYPVKFPIYDILKKNKEAKG
ncbi:flagellar assembly factor FliW [Butyrivibrio fibrisolvens]|uniref:Flagellar assembly factor FliW n=1 Tax=Butyrivibrio fibrisolvens TaxID=831 RepID=A0A1H9TTL8_BUTFI|nr:flagellar assembly protein FliW [Butyrivibrio fibrisolvens]SES00446.1 flagellar assembly factor FliW [Butyrivibrio fibrisolvens]